MRLHRPMKKLIQLSTLGFCDTNAQGFKFSAIFFRHMTLASDQRGNQHRKNGPGFPTLVRKIGLDQCPQASDHHLVANAENNRSIVSVSLDHSCKGGRAKISSE